MAAAARGQGRPRKTPQDRKPRTVSAETVTPDPVEFDDADAPIDLDALPEQEADLVPLFVLGGRTYLVDRDPPPSVGLRTLKLAREQGRDIAVGWMLETLIGEEGYEALCDARIPRDAMDEIVTRALRVTVGQVEAAAIAPLGRG